MDMHLFIETGQVVVLVWYQKENKPMVKDYNKNEPNKWITYSDTNNLYGRLRIKLFQYKP